MTTSSEPTAATVLEDAQPVQEPIGRCQPDAAEIRRRLSDGGPKGENIKITGRTRKLASEKGVDLQEVIGTGPQGRIIEKDVLLYVEKRRITVAALRGQSEPLTRMRQAIARKVLHSKQTIPHFYVTAAVDMTAAMAVRDSLRCGSGDISVTDWAVKASALALKAFPRLNSRIQEERKAPFTSAK